MGIHGNHFPQFFRRELLCVVGLRISMSETETASSVSTVEMLSTLGTTEQYQSLQKNGWER